METFIKIYKNLSLQVKRQGARTHVGKTLETSPGRRALLTSGKQRKTKLLTRVRQVLLRVNSVVYGYTIALCAPARCRSVLAHCARAKGKDARSARARPSHHYTRLLIAMRTSLRLRITTFTFIHHRLEGAEKRSRSTPIKACAGADGSWISV
ncbi:hypothetical protein EVAR_78925_1 [Eumeta japonica]|uniref:Uncharacterized protein n=1 Tax=Eumeta variegata TaxID=151549 RepID=A0A4C1U3Z4_EUMVA|nr:hypothetical protein EVAR_78925_1 [Eumeta japonica]